MRVLHVEDDAGFALVVRELLTDQGHDVVCAADIRDAWAALPDEECIILCDNRLPDGTGIELVRRLRAAGRDDPCYLMTALIDDATQAAALDAGCQGVIEKSVDLAALEAQLARALPQAA